MASPLTPDADPRNADWPKHQQEECCQCRPERVITLVEDIGLDWGAIYLDGVEVWQHHLSDLAPSGVLRLVGVPCGTVDYLEARKHLPAVSRGRYPRTLAEFAIPTLAPGN